MWDNSKGSNNEALTVVQARFDNDRGHEKWSHLDILKEESIGFIDELDKQYKRMESEISPRYVCVCVCLLTCACN